MKIIYSTLFVLGSLFFTACGGGEQAQQAIEASETLAQDNSSSTNSGIRLTDFKTRFNEYLSQIGSPYNIAEFKQSKDSGIVAINYRFNKNIFLTGKLKASSDNLSEATLIMGSDGSQNAAIEVIMMMNALVKATNPQMTPQEVEQALTTIGMLNPDQDLLKLDSEIEIKGIKYHIIFIEHLGFMFSAMMQ